MWLVRRRILFVAVVATPVSVAAAAAAGGGGCGGGGNMKMNGMIKIKMDSRIARGVVVLLDVHSVIAASAAAAMQEIAIHLHGRDSLAGGYIGSCAEGSWRRWSGIEIGGGGMVAWLE